MPKPKSVETIVKQQVQACKSNADKEKKKYNRPVRGISQRVRDWDYNDNKWSDKRVEEELLLRVMAGQPLNDIAQLQHMPSINTLYDHIRKNPDFREKYFQARQASGDSIYNQILDIEEHILQGSIQPYPGKVLLSSMQWRLSRIDRANFGERTHVTKEHTGSVEVKVNVFQEGKLTEITKKIEEKREQQELELKRAQKANQKAIESVKKYNKEQALMKKGKVVESDS